MLAASLLGIDDKIQPFEQWRSPTKIVSLDPWGHMVTETFAETKSPKGHFIIKYAPGPDATIAGLAGEVLDTAWETIGEDLGIIG